MNLSGDEREYFKRSQFLEHIFDDFRNGDDLTTTLKKRTEHLYGKHFMPGTSFILALPQLFTDDPKFLRLTLLFFNVFLVIFSASIVFNYFTSLRSVIFLLLMGILPLNALGSMLLWNDFVCGIILLLSYLTFAHYFFHAGSNRIYYRNMLLVGTILGLAFIFRYNTLAIAFFLGVFIFFDLIVRQRRLKFFTLTGLSLLVGFLLLYGPWMIASSLKNNNLFLVPKPTMQYAIQTWTISPPMEDMLGYRKGPRYKTTVRELMKLHGIDKYTAQKLILNKVKQTATFKSRLRAYRANFDNFFRNPNQFLGVLMFKASGKSKSDWTIDVTEKPLTRFHTHGGQFFPKTMGNPYEANRYMQPSNKLQRIYLLWNDSVYGLLIAFLLASFSVSLTKKSLSPGPYIWPFILGPCLIPFFHPAHGRYIFALLPILTYAASFYGESLIKLWKEGDTKEIKAVCTLTCLFFLFVMM